MNTDADRRTAAVTPMRVALDSIQEAQRLLEHASQALARVDGMTPERRRIASLADHLTQTWVAVAASANRIQCENHTKPTGRS